VLPHLGGKITTTTSAHPRTRVVKESPIEDIYQRLTRISHQAAENTDMVLLVVVKLAWVLHEGFGF
jgi:hypothetical protein